jgi:transposase
MSLRNQTIPGINELTAWNPVAEIGVNMDQFPSPQQLASWRVYVPATTRAQASADPGRHATERPG